MKFVRIFLEIVELLIRKLVVKKFAMKGRELVLLCEDVDEVKHGVLDFAVFRGGRGNGEVGVVVADVFVARGTNGAGFNF